MITHAAYLGDFVAERAVLLARVPEEALEAAQVRAVHLLVGEDAPLDRNNSWLLQLGLQEAGKFKVISREVPLDGALRASVVRRIALEDPALLSRGDSLAIRLSPRGLPPPLSGVSIIVEWGVHASRRGSRA